VWEGGRNQWEMVVWISMFEDGVLPVSPTPCVQEPANLQRTVTTKPL
jgi:hypothetical protein